MQVAPSNHASPTHSRHQKWSRTQLLNQISSVLNTLLLNLTFAVAVNHPLREQTLSERPIARSTAHICIISRYQLDRNFTADAEDKQQQRVPLSLVSLASTA